jgi:hypothetical protein
MCVLFVSHTRKGYKSCFASSDNFQVISRKTGRSLHDTLKFNRTSQICGHASKETHPIAIHHFPYHSISFNSFKTKTPKRVLKNRSFFFSFWLCAYNIQFRCHSWEMLERTWTSEFPKIGVFCAKKWQKTIANLLQYKNKKEKTQNWKKTDLARENRQNTELETTNRTKQQNKP